MCLAEATVVGPKTPLQRALRKASWRLLPLLGVCYLVAYMDRANISFAAETMDRDLGLSAAVYGLGAGLFFLTYAACEVPSNALLLRFGARPWLARIMVTWGLVAAAMLLARGTRSFYLLRLMLGVAEAGYFPGVMFYLAMWFPPEQRARAISRFYISLPMSTIVMGLAAGSLLHLDGRLGLRGWQWLFLVEGLPAVVLGLCVWWMLPESPATANWLDEDERAAVLAAAVPKTRVVKVEGEQEDIWVGLRSGRNWSLAAIFFCGFIAIYGLTFSLPLLLRMTTGRPAAQVGYMIAGAGVVGAATMLLNAAHSDRTAERLWHIIAPLMLMMAGFVYAGLHLHGWVTGMVLLAVPVCWYTLQGPLLGMCTTVVPGRGGAIAFAAINTLAIMGGFLGPYWMGWMREVSGSYAVGVGSLAAPLGVAVVGLVVLERGRVVEGV